MQAILCLIPCHRTGVVEQFFADFFAAMRWQAMHEQHAFGGQIEQLGDIFADSLHGIAIAKDDTALAQAVQAAVQKLIDDSDYTTILDTWGNASGAVTTAELNPVVS